MTMRYWIQNLLPQIVNRRISRRRRRSHMAAEVLEIRALLSTFTVSNVLDSGPGSLRDAIDQANSYSNNGDDTIVFDSSFDTARTITLTGGQLEITDGGFLTIIGPEAGVTVSGGGMSRVFLVSVEAGAVISRITIAGGTADNGGGLANFGGIFFLDNCTISGNTAANNGGGIYDNQNSFGAHLSNCTFSGNTAGNNGGGIYSSRSAYLDNCTISGNTAESRGGGIFNAGVADYGGTTFLTNCTVSGNTALASGGGVSNDGGGTISLTNCTVSGNSALLGGGIFADAAPSVTLINTIVAGNTDEYSNARDIQGFVSGSYNLIGTGGSGGLIDGVDGNIVGVANPLLAPLGNYGGPTQTMPLLPGSLAINGGIGGAGIPATDQRGMGRVGAVDIGAFESQGFTVSNNADSGPGSLRAAIELANLTPGADTIDFDSSFNTPQTITLTGSQLEFLDAATTTITGPAAGVTVSGGWLSRVFLVNLGSSASISGMTITEGFADNGGGVSNFGDLTLSNFTVYYNRVSDSGSGGGLYNNGTISLTNCTLCYNDASYFGSGAGMFNAPDGNAMLTNCTVSQNYGFYGGGIFNAPDGNLMLINTIVADNSGIPGAGDIDGSFVSGSYNLIGESGSSGLVDGVDGNIVGVSSPFLAFPGNYGGPALTMPLLPGSAALDAGTSTGAPPTDQRGEPRFGAVDIGAFESQGFTFTAVPGSTPQSSDIGTAFANRLAVDVVANNWNEPVDGGVVNFVANPAFNGASAIFSASSPVITGGLIEITAAPNNFTGSYTVVASAGALSATFDLTNTGTPFAALVVNTTSDLLAPGPGLLSLREAIGFANTDPSGTAEISFDAFVFASPQTITLTMSQLELTHGTHTIIGPAAGVTVSGNQERRVFQVDAGVIASIRGLTIADGYSSGYYEGGAGVFNSGTITLTECTLSGNSAPFQGHGGGIFNAPYGIAMLTNCTVSGNYSYYGGGMYNAPHGAATLTNCIVSGNTAHYSGGGLSNSGTTTLTACTFSGNTGIGGGIFNGDGALTMTDCDVSGNTAESRGGGIFNAYGALTMTDCNISDNTAEFRGGGIQNGYGGALTMSGCTVSGNTAIFGGGVADYGGTTFLTNCTVSGNTALSTGGGVSNSGGGMISLTNCTVSGNTARIAGGGLDSLSASHMSLINTIVAGNTNEFSNASNIDGFVSGSYNLIGNGGSGGLLNGVDGNIVGVANALLAPLGDYGGSTQTMPLLPGSLAINGGTSGAGIPGTDQRGMGRVGAVDIGAFESQGFAITLVGGGTPQTAIVGNAFANALAVNVTANNPNEPVNGGVVTFVATPAANGASATFSGSAVISGGQASVIATANLIVGSYVVSANMTGAAPVSFALNNITTVNASATSVGWGSQTRGLAGRTNLPWTNISKFVLTFNSPVAPTAGDLTVTGRGGRVYVVSSVSVVGNTVTWTLTAPITAADIVTVTVNPLLAIYSIQLRILPGDVNDDGVVNSQDQILVRNAFLGIGPISTIPRAFFDLDGDGVVTVTDYNLARRYNGTRL